MVMVVFPEPGAGMDGGLNVTVTPWGTLTADSATGALNLLTVERLSTQETCLPCLTVNVDARRKFGFAARAIPRNAMLVLSPVALLVPTTMVSRVPVSVTGICAAELGQV